ncbi:MAG: class IIb bacteriocin, lactobin A/cerein 7B family [Bacilli bacterium]|nr:class IIb bacteriocin, lactobin A/cerein 7B family [Bacilli bacterium]
MSNEELSNIKGGAFKWTIIGGIMAIGAFVAGIIDGYLRPYKCR